MVSVCVGCCWVVSSVYKVGLFFSLYEEGYDERD
jgi:hypothetical protein